MFNCCTIPFYEMVEIVLSDIEADVHQTFSSTITDFYVTELVIKLAFLKAMFRAFKTVNRTK